MQKEEGEVLLSGHPSWNFLLEIISYRMNQNHAHNVIQSVNIPVLCYDMLHDLANTNSKLQEVIFSLKHALRITNKGELTSNSYFKIHNLRRQCTDTITNFTIPLTCSMFFLGISPASEV